MPTPRFAQLDPARRATILAVASAEFAAKGYAKASYNAIIRDAGLSKGVMYYYFEDKADLCRTVVLEQLAPVLALGQGLQLPEHGAGFWPQLQDLMGHMLAALEHTPDAAALGRLIYGEGSSTDVLGPLLRDAEAWCANVLSHGQTLGAVRDDLPLSLLASTVTGVLVHSDRWFAAHAHTLASPELHRLSAACLHMVEQIASPRTPSP